MEFHCWGKCNVVIDILRDGTNSRDRDHFNNRHHTVRHASGGEKKKFHGGTQAPMPLMNAQKEKQQQPRSAENKIQRTTEKQKEKTKHVQAAGVNDTKMKTQAIEQASSHQDGVAVSLHH